MKIYRLLAIVMALCTILTMVACTTEKSPETPTTDSTEEQTTLKEDVTTAPPADSGNSGDSGNDSTDSGSTDSGNDSSDSGDSGDVTPPTPKYSWATQGGDGTAEKPLIINQTNFVEFYNYYIKGGWNGFIDPNEYFKLDSDIVVNEGDAATWETTAPAVAFNQPMNEFFGTLDGDNHTISGLYIKTSGARAALFHQLAAGAIVKNLRVTNSYFEVDSTGYDSAATIAGRLLGGLIENCYSDAIIKCNTTGTINVMLGGIAGMVNSANSRIYNCVFAGEVTGAAAADVGGILGKVNSGASTYAEIKNCLNLGSLKGKKVGGILGSDMNPEANNDCNTTITNCINLSKNIVRVKDGVESEHNYIYGRTTGLTINTYVITEFMTKRELTDDEKASDTVITIDGVAYDVKDGTAEKITVVEKSLAEFLALTGTDLAGWNFKDGCIPCPIQGLEILLADYLTAWGITLS